MAVTISFGTLVPVLLLNPPLNFFALESSDRIVARPFPPLLKLLTERLW